MMRESHPMVPCPSQLSTNPMKQSCLADLQLTMDGMSSPAEIKRYAQLSSADPQNSKLNKWLVCYTATGN